jgi:hypothetical protein
MGRSSTIASLDACCMQVVEGKRNPPAVATALLLPFPSDEEEGGFPEFWLILFLILFLYK